jgi:hypothetical protein
LRHVAFFGAPALSSGRAEAAGLLYHVRAGLGFAASEALRYTQTVKKAVRGGEALEAIDARLEDMERKLDRLRSLYESFFMGTERIPPNVPRRELNRLVIEMQQAPIGNAMLRFRFQSLLQRWVMLTTYWNRTMREIEAGTYARDLSKANRHLSARGTAMTEEEARRLGIPANRVKAFVGRQQKLSAARLAAGGPQEEPPVPAAKATPALPVSGAGAEPIPGLAAGDLEAFYARFVEAHRSATGAAPKATLEQMRTKLQNELPRLLGDKGGRVSLDVEVEGGKVRLKARPVR